jgi:hypothetical protein
MDGKPKQRRASAEPAAEGAASSGRRPTNQTRRRKAPLRISEGNEERVRPSSRRARAKKSREVRHRLGKGERRSVQRVVALGTARVWRCRTNRTSEQWLVTCSRHQASMRRPWIAAELRKARLRRFGASIRRPGAKDDQIIDICDRARDADDNKLLGLRSPKKAAVF